MLKKYKAVVTVTTDDNVDVVKLRNSVATAMDEMWAMGDFHAEVSAFVEVSEKYKAADSILEDIQKLIEERDAERLRYGQQCARSAVFIRTLSTLARRGPEFQAIAQDAVKKADEAASQVSMEDFTTATVKGRPQSDG